MKKTRYFLIGIIVMVLLLSTMSSLGSTTTMENKQIENLESNPASRGAVLEVTTDKTLYNLGERVAIFLTNIGDETLRAGGPIVTIYDEYNEIVYQEACYCYWELEPGEYITWPPWDQTDQQGNQVPLGRYIVEGILFGNDENYNDNATFYIDNYDPPYGPTEGVVGVEYIFCIDLPVNPDGDQYYIRWDFGDGTITEWLGPCVPGETVCEVHSWDEPGDYDIRVGIKDVYGVEYWTDPLTIHIRDNNPPGAPDIFGPFWGKVGVEYEYTFVATDPDGDPVFYYIDWGDGNVVEWFGPYESGVEVKKSHTWNEMGTYTIRAKAKDIHGAEGPWGTQLIPIQRGSQSQQSGGSQQSSGSSSSQSQTA